MEFQLEQEYKFCEYMMGIINGDSLTMEQLLYGIATEIGTEGSAGLNDVIRKFLREEYLDNKFSHKDEITNTYKEEFRLYSLSNKGKNYFRYLKERKEFEAFTLELNKSTVKTNKSITIATWVIAVVTVINVIITIASYFKKTPCESLQQSPKIQVQLNK